MIFIFKFRIFDKNICKYIFQICSNVVYFQSIKFYFWSVWSLLWIHSKLYKHIDYNTINNIAKVKAKKLNSWNYHIVVYKRCMFLFYYSSKHHQSFNQNTETCEIILTLDSIIWYFAHLQSHKPYSFTYVQFNFFVVRTYLEDITWYNIHSW